MTDREILLANVTEMDNQDWLFLLPTVLIEDEVINVDTEHVIITYKRICSYNKETYSFEYSLEYDGMNFNESIDENSIKKVFKKVVEKIVYE